MEVRNEVRDEVRNEVRNEVRDEVRDGGEGWRALGNCWVGRSG